jgi:hypothetical protein
MSEPEQTHRLDGLEPDNLLAFLALLGLLRTLEVTRPQWRPRASWDLYAPPLRPVLNLFKPASRDEICAAATDGIATLASAVNFGSATDLKLPCSEAKKLLAQFAEQIGSDSDAGRYFADLCAALISDAALARDQAETAPTPLSYPTVARINFLAGLTNLLRAELPEQKNRTRDSKFPKTAANCLAQALFERWARIDRPAGLRWDPEEAKRHAYQWSAPTDEQPKTQHGANRLAIVGLSALTAAPVQAGSEIRLFVIAGNYDRSGFTLAWPIWTRPASLAAIRALLSHPRLREPGALEYLGVDHVRLTHRISLDRYRNFSFAGPLQS